MGRRRTPTTLKLLNGNPGRRPLNEHEPQPDALDAGLPRELTSKAARDEWRRAIVPAIRIGHITSADRVLAVAHCELWATWRSQLKAAERLPHIVASGKHRYPMPNAARTQANRTLMMLAKIDDQIGFSPTSRSRVQASGPGSSRAAADTRRERFLKASDTRG